MSIHDSGIRRATSEGGRGAGPSVLVTDGMQKKALSVVRAIVGTAAEIGVVSPYPVSMAGVSRHVDRQHRIVADGPDDYVRKLNDLVSGVGYDHALPIAGRSFELFSTRRDEICAPVESILPPARSMAVAVDKHRVHRLAEEKGVPSPATRRVESRNDLEGHATDVGFPLVLKSGNETDARFVGRADSRAELRRLYGRYRRRHDADPLLQEYLPGDGYGYFGFYLEGECLGSYTHHRVREYPPSGGASACAESDRDPELLRFGERLLDALDWTGVVMVEFKADADGTPHVLEINPKFWGSLDLGIRSGLNFPAALLRHAAGDEPRPLSFEPTRVHWPLSGDFQHGLSRPEAMGDVLGDVLSSRTASNIRLDDSLPHVVELGKAMVRPFVTDANDGG